MKTKEPRKHRSDRSVIVEKVDWTSPDAELARKYKVSRQRISVLRKQFGHPPDRTLRRGPKISTPRPKAAQWKSWILRSIEQERRRRDLSIAAIGSDSEMLSGLVDAKISVVSRILSRLCGVIVEKRSGRTVANPHYVRDGTALHHALRVMVMDSGRTITEIANRAGISQPALSSAMRENGRDIYVSTWEKIIAALGGAKVVYGQLD